MCCVCSGFCNHTGPHSFCAAHGVANQVYTPLPTMQPWQFYGKPCEHCYCLDAGEGHPDHKQCCKCFTRMHVQFIAQLKPEGA